MNIISWQFILFASIFVLMVVGLVTLLFSRSSYAKNKAIPFAFANGFGVVVWLASLVYTRYVQDTFLAHRIAFSAAYILVVGMFGLALTYPNSSLSQRFKQILAVDMLVGAAAIGLVLFTSKILAAANFLGAKPAPFSSLGRVYLLVLAAHLVAAIVIFVRRYLTEVRNRLYFNYIVLAFILFFLIAVTTNLILPLTGVVAFALVGPLAALLPFATVVYALGITDLNDISYIVTQLLQVGARLVIVIGLFVAGVLAHHLLKVGYYSSGWVIAMSVIAGICVVGLYLIGSAFDRYIENHIAFTRLSPEEARARLVVSLRGKIDLEQGVPLVLKLIKQALGIRAAGIALSSKDGTFWSSGELTIDEPNMDSVIKAMGESPRHNSDQSLLHVSTLPAAQQAYLEGQSIYAVKPLRSESGVVGLYLLGGKFSQEVFTRQDAQLMHVISEIGDLSIERALFYSQIQAFNATLQQRIDSATQRLRKANKRLLTLDAMKDDFISMASHQLRSPATSLHDAIKLLEQTYTTPAERKKIVELADASSERLVSVITDMLSVARIQAGHFTIEKTPVDMVELVQRVAQQAAVLAEEKKIRLRIEVPKQPVNVTADRAKIIEILSNYVENAIRYSEDTTDVVVSLVQDGKRTMVEVRDQGIGVPLRERAHLFDKFFRATNARKEQPNGNGIGLFVVKTVAKAHGGDVYYRPLSPGSLFGFWLKSDK